VREDIWVLFISSPYQLCNASAMPRLSTRDASILPKGCTVARRSGGIRELNDALLAAGIAMNQAGGLLKVSPDSGLLQSSTLADEARARRATSGSCVSHLC